jgi:hypothetical protein
MSTWDQVKQQLTESQVWQSIVRHGYDVKCAQPADLHVVTWHGFSQMLFYFSERGPPGPMSFSSSRRLYRKKPDKLG